MEIARVRSPFVGLNKGKNTVMVQKTTSPEQLMFPVFYAGHDDNNQDDSQVIPIITSNKTRRVSRKGSDSKQLTLRDIARKVRHQDMDWELIEWAQAPLAPPDTTCTWHKCLDKHTRDTDEGAFCIDCWRALPRCRECGAKASRLPDYGKGWRCYRCSNPWDDDRDLEQTARDILFCNTAWDGVF